MRTGVTYLGIGILLFHPNSHLPLCYEITNLLYLLFTHMVFSVMGKHLLTRLFLGGTKVPAILRNQHTTPEGTFVLLSKYFAQRIGTGNTLPIEQRLSPFIFLIPWKHEIFIILTLRCLFLSFLLVLMEDV